MIKKDKLLELMQTKVYKPLTEDELVEKLSQHEDEAAPWRQLIAELEQEGIIVRTRYGRYGLPQMMNLVVGHLQGNVRGFAFLLAPGREDDVFISASNLNGAMHGDKVIVRLLPRRQGKKEEGEVIRILERANEFIVGRFEGDDQFGFCQPDERRISQDIFIARGDTGGAQTGDKVVVRITRFPAGRHPATAVVEEVLGKVGDPGVDVLAVVRQYDLPEEFPADVKHQVAQMRLEITDADLDGRLDLRHWPTITIDGPDAKDLDDAISLQRLPHGNYKLGVHIADVSHYVRPGTPLDEEALARGNSVYLLDRVLPMLPPELSNGICSLNPDADRLTLSVLMEIDANGQLVQSEIAESVIRSHARLTYDEVNQILEQGKADLPEHLAQLQQMHELRNILAQQRAARGAIDFEVQEAQVILDEEGRVQDIVPRAATLADSIIEEFMVKANEAIAERFFWLDIPFIYRVHEKPKPDTVNELNNFLGAFGLRIKAKSDAIHPKSFQNVLQQVEGRREQRLIHRVLLRSMMRARYSPECLGHFGLALQYYAHFTAPIRRYSDLAIHRIIKEHLRRPHFSAQRQEQLVAFVERAANIASMREQVATEAERAVVDMKKVEFMQGKEGVVYEAIVSGVTNFGFFAELDNTVGGLVHVSSLDDDYYQFEEDAYALVGRRTTALSPGRYCASQGS